MKNFYAVLGVQPSISAEDLKKQYRKLAMEHHPDRGGSEDKFKEITEAYTALNANAQKSTDDILNDLFWESFRHAASKPRRVRYDPAAENRMPVHIMLTIEDIREGRTFDYSILRSTSCSDCPPYAIKPDCKTCQGYGFTNSSHPLKLKVEEVK